METFSNNTGHYPTIPKNNGSRVILQVLYCFTFAAIIIINIVLLWRLVFKLKKTRSNILFMLLSVPDIFVAVISIPILALAVFITDLKVVLFHVMYLWYYITFPTLTHRAWRLLYSSGFVIIKKYAYVKTISKNRLMAIALVLLVVEAGVSFVFSTVKPSTRIRSQFVIE